MEITDIVYVIGQIIGLAAFVAIMIVIIYAILKFVNTSTEMSKLTKTKTQLEIRKLQKELQKDQD